MGSWVSYGKHAEIFIKCVETTDDQISSSREEEGTGKNGTTKEKHLLPLIPTSYLLMHTSHTSHTLHTHTHPRTHIHPSGMQNTHRVWSVCMCVWAVPCQSAALQWEAKLCCGCGSSEPAPPTHACHVTQHNKTRLFPSNLSAPPSNKARSKKKERKENLNKMNKDNEKVEFKHCAGRK